MYLKYFRTLMTSARVVVAHTRNTWENVTTN